jgi:hypothetical protein
VSLINFGSVDGRLKVTTAAVTGLSANNGLLYRPLDQALYSVIAVPVRWLNGLPIDAVGRLAMSSANDAVAYYNQGFAFNILNELLFTSSFPIARYKAGWPVDAEGRICVTLL